VSSTLQFFTTISRNEKKFKFIILQIRDY
jgi:hypothetical protein